MGGPASPLLRRGSLTARYPLRVNSQRTRVAVVFGGRSSEHAISCVSAGSILRNLDPQRFEVVAVGITPEGAWVLTDGNPDALAITDRQLPTVSTASGAELALAADPQRAGQLVAMSSTGPAEVLESVDVVFPVLHGPYGEDGTVQGLLELAGVPYVGAGVLASAAGMDKEFTKKLLAAEGLPIGPYAVLRAAQETLSMQDRERLGLPLFVKPARGGSSIGVSRVTSYDELAAAIAEARRHDPKVIVEAAIVGREIECGVLEFPDGMVAASTVGEIRVAGVQDRDDSFYDFATKYLDDAAELDVPAKIDDHVADAVRQLAIRAFAALDCQGLARVDFFLTDDGPVINEINTMPGFTTISMYPRMWSASGVDYPTLLATMVDTALARGVGLR
ncbi:D-alanine--D-alanine ligase [Mycolicibacter longobardus]|nr:D-alanine--D-alanine ligase [Mycolicibacter longobardus]